MRLFRDIVSMEEKKEKEKWKESNKITRMKRDARPRSYVDLCTLWCVLSPFSPHLASLASPSRPHLVSSVPALPSARLLPPLTSNSTRRVHRSVCAINPNNFELKSLHVEFPFTYTSLASIHIIYICILFSLFIFSSKGTSAALVR